MRKYAIVNYAIDFLFVNKNLECRKPFSVLFKILPYYKNWKQVLKFQQRRTMRRQIWCSTYWWWHFDRLMQSTKWKQLFSVAFPSLSRTKWVHDSSKHDRIITQKVSHLPGKTWSTTCIFCWKWSLCFLDQMFIKERSKLAFFIVQTYHLKIKCFTFV